ncbi:alpha-protein kinase 2 isoform X2 [Brachyhypopomus gauderio]|uniref:alpha-protein kinase 2 isoform X2 n=1 Tax=Brachyhypopomus gauderio TaxID=698409 RepID=UPI00404102D2
MPPRSTPPRSTTWYPRPTEPPPSELQASPAHICSGQTWRIQDPNDALASTEHPCLDKTMEIQTTDVQNETETVHEQTDTVDEHTDTGQKETDLQNVFDLLQIPAQIISLKKDRSSEEDMDEVNMTLAQADEAQADLAQADVAQADVAQADEAQADVAQADEAQADESQADEAQADVTQADVAQADEAQADVTQADVAQAHGAQAHVAQADLAQADVAQADVAKADLAQADLAQADVAQDDVAQADEAQGDVAQADVAQADEAQADVAQANVAQADVAQADVAQADVAQADVAQADVAQADEAQADVAQVDLEQVDEAQADVAQADEAQADVAQADVAQADVAQANVAQVDLEQVDEAQADVAQADIAQADVTQADVTQADVAQADVTQADVAQADVAQADVAQADVTQADVAQAGIRTDAVRNPGIFSQIGDKVRKEEGTKTRSQPTTNITSITGDVSNVAENNSGIVGLVVPENVTVTQSCFAQKDIDLTSNPADTDLCQNEGEYTTDPALKTNNTDIQDHISDSTLVLHTPEGDSEKVGPSQPFQGAVTVRDRRCASQGQTTYHSDAEETFITQDPELSLPVCQLPSELSGVTESPSHASPEVGAGAHFTLRQPDVSRVLEENISCSVPGLSDVVNESEPDTKTIERNVAGDTSSETQNSDESETAGETTQIVPLIRDMRGEIICSSDEKRIIDVTSGNRDSESGAVIGANTDSDICCIVGETECSIDSKISSIVVQTAHDTDCVLKDSTGEALANSGADINNVTGEAMLNSDPEICDVIRQGLNVGSSSLSYVDPVPRILVTLQPLGRLAVEMNKTETVCETSGSPLHPEDVSTNSTLGSSDNNTLISDRTFPDFSSLPEGILSNTAVNFVGSILAQSPQDPVSELKRDMVESDLSEPGDPDSHRISRLSTLTFHQPESSALRSSDSGLRETDNNVSSHLQVPGVPHTSYESPVISGGLKRDVLLADAYGAPAAARDLDCISTGQEGDHSKGRGVTYSSELSSDELWLDAFQFLPCEEDEGFVLESGQSSALCPQSTCTMALPFPTEMQATASQLSRDLELPPAKSWSSSDSWASALSEWLPSVSVPVEDLIKTSGCGSEHQPQCCMAFQDEGERLDSDALWKVTEDRTSQLVPDVQEGEGNSGPLSVSGYTSKRNTKAGWDEEQNLRCSAHLHTHTHTLLDLETEHLTHTHTLLNSEPNHLTHTHITERDIDCTSHTRTQTKDSESHVCVNTHSSELIPGTGRGDEPSFIMPFAPVSIGTSFLGPSPKEKHSSPQTSLSPALSGIEEEKTSEEPDWNRSWPTDTDESSHVNFPTHSGTCCAQSSSSSSIDSEETSSQDGEIRQEADDIRAELARLILLTGERFMVSEEKRIAYVTLDLDDVVNCTKGPGEQGAQLSGTHTSCEVKPCAEEAHKAKMPHKTSKTSCEGKVCSKRRQTTATQENTRTETHAATTGKPSEISTAREVIVVKEKMTPKPQGKKKKKNVQHGTPKAESAALVENGARPKELKTQSNGREATPLPPKGGCVREKPAIPPPLTSVVGGASETEAVRADKAVVGGAREMKTFRADKAVVGGASKAEAVRADKAVVGGAREMKTFRADKAVVGGASKAEAVRADKAVVGGARQMKAFRADKAVVGGASKAEAVRADKAVVGGAREMKALRADKAVVGGASETMVVRADKAVVGGASKAEAVRADKAVVGRSSTAGLEPLIIRPPNAQDDDLIKRRRMSGDGVTAVPIRTRPQLPAIFRQKKEDEDVSSRAHRDTAKQPKEAAVPRVMSEIQVAPVPGDSHSISLWCQFSPVSADTSITWTKEGATLSEEKIRLVDDSRVSLSIVKACSKDLGMYRCTLTCVLGSVCTSDYHLTSEVLMEFVIPSHDTADECREVEGEEEDVFCAPLLFKDSILTDQYFGENQPASIVTEKAHFGEGMHRKAFRAVLRTGAVSGFSPGHPCVLKVHNSISYGTKNIEELTKRNYDLAVEECFVQNTAREYIKAYTNIAKSAESFGDVPEIIPIYLVHRPSSEIPYATLEEELIGDFVKYSVRDGKEVNLTRRDSESGQKSCTFQHWVYEQTGGNLLVTDMQGVGMKLTDVGISTSKKGYNGFKGNCSTSFIDQFEALHQCNRFCELLGLTSLQAKSTRTAGPPSKTKPQPGPKKQPFGAILKGKS